MLSEDTKTSPSDKERLEWCLKYGVVRTLGVAQDFDYLPITLELIDGEIARKAIQKATSSTQTGE
jgi:hypothetical protein